MSIIQDRLAYLEPLKLGHGTHPAPDNGMRQACVMEAVAYVAGERWSDHPECASPVLGAFLRSWNDGLDDNDRQMLKPLIPRLVGTKGTAEQEAQRAWMATDWLARECAPTFLRLAGLTDHAEALERLAALTSTARAKKAQSKLDAARAAAGDAARATAARAAAGDAARATAARAAARAAAWAAARDAAWAAAWDAAWAAARDAAWAALAPTVKQLQQSALLLLDRMIAVAEAGPDSDSPRKHAEQGTQDVA